VRGALVVLSAIVVAFRPLPALAQSEPGTVLDHAPDQPFYVGGQVNIIAQAHGQFPAPYSGPNSLRPFSEDAVSRLLTLYLGVRLRDGLEAIVHLESAGGHGISDALGLAGFTNLDVVRNPSLGAAPYLARFIVRKVFALSDESVEVAPTPLSLAPRLPAKRLDIRVGKFGIADFFDVNSVGSDSHLQFTNWTVDNNGGFDYAADTRGYTYAVMAEYATPRWSLRAAEALMPKVANGIELDWDIGRARGENVELELRPNDALVVRALGYVNHANMGRYEEAIEAFERGVDPQPNIEAHRRQGRVKYGVGGNMEYATSSGPRFFARAGWNEGRNESFAYTEVNQTIAGGIDLAGRPWHRANDRVGAAFVSNGLSTPHREYLRLGGLGFLLGDGTLRYARENILETYYTAHVWRGVSAAAGAQYITHPGYNADRGPVLVGMLRTHVDF
jgi:hypothetical protein